MIGDIITAILTFFIVIGALLLAILPLLIPYLVFKSLARGFSSTQRKGERSIKDEVVKAQWEYDNIWKRGQK